MIDDFIERAEGKPPTFSWAGQALQYDQLGPPKAVVYQRHSTGKFPELQIADCLLYYDENRRLAGILNYYPQGAWETHGTGDGIQLEKPGNINTFIRPDLVHTPAGAAVLKRMFDEARSLWGIRDFNPVEDKPLPGPNPPMGFDGQHRWRT